MMDSELSRKSGSVLLRLLQLSCPPQPYAPPKDKVFGAFGAFVGVFGLVAGSQLFIPQLTIPVVASMGASAVLLFAAPHSPLAQPWPFAGGHLLSAMVGVSCYQSIPGTYMAAASAVSLAIALMHFLHCLHPPGGATALMAVLGGDAVHELGFGYVLAPVAINVFLFLTLALLVNNLLIPRRRYPVLATHPAEKTAVVSGPFRRLGVERADVEQALQEIGAYIDVTGYDLEEIYSRATLHAARRALARVKVCDVMQREVPRCEYGDELEAIWEHMRADRHQGVPVIDRSGRVVGIVTIVDFLKHVDGRVAGTPIERLARLIRRTSGPASNKPEVVGQIMTAPAITVHDNAPIAALIPLFADDRIHHLPVVDSDDRLVGMVTQSELLATLHRRRAAAS
jgi:CBS domain-containing membrane protein